MKTINIAIDGPAGAGKSTIARWVAGRLSYVYIDTGAMYRALTWVAMKRVVGTDDARGLQRIVQDMSLDLIPTGDGQRVLVDGEDVTDHLRSEQVSGQVSHVAGHPQVREEMVRRQRQLAKNKGVVMDGRDIGTYVLPDAELKIFLTASLDERAKRRYAEMKQKNQQTTLGHIRRQIEERDQMDRNRATAPLRPAEDAVHLDTTGLDIDQVGARILNMVEERKR